MIVMKFGGTSNQDATAMRNVLRIVGQSLDRRPVVVISAIAKGTNELEQTARLARDGDEAGAVRVLQGLMARHDAILADLVHDPSRITALHERFQQYRAEILRLVNGIAVLGELTARSMDAVCSYGERLSSSLIAAGLQEQGVDAVWVDTRDFMVTDDAFGNARPLMDVVTGRLEQIVRPLLDAGRVPVTQGFIGVTRSGASTTMGRESSDYSASIIGAAMRAESVEIWTDVDGILTADPSVVKKPALVTHMSFQEAFELSYFGAKVLHPGTMLPVLERNIPVKILNSKNTASPGTLVDAGAGTEGAVKSIAYKRGMSIVAVRPHRRLNQYMFWDSVYNVLTRHGVVTGTTASAEYALAVTVDSRTDVTALVRDLAEVGTVEVKAGFAALCLVGDGMREARGMLGRVARGLGDVAVPMIGGGASGASMTVLVAEADLSAALNGLHCEFFGAGSGA